MADPDADLGLFDEDEGARVCSHSVAERFGVSHAALVRALGALDRGPDFMAANFTALGVGFQMTRDGCEALSAGFGGEDAARLRLRYRRAFDFMEALAAAPIDLRMFPCRPMPPHAAPCRFQAGGASTEGRPDGPPL